MRDEESKVVRMKKLKILDTLSDYRQLADKLFERGCLESINIEELFESKLTQFQKCQLLLDMITSDTSSCSLYDFIAVLRLCDKPLVDLADDIIQTAESLEISWMRSPVYEKVRKVNVYTTSRRRAEELGNMLKRLSHDGDVATFEQYTRRIHTIFKSTWNRTTDVRKRMELAELRFTCLEAEIVQRRVYYDESLYEHSVFRELRQVIPYTCNPIVTSMTYCARYGSALSMRKGIEAGLGQLDYSKKRAENIVPCRETGMVYYIEVNLLFQLYEKNPTDSMKKRILSTAELAIAQFINESEDVRNDYKRMLLLKMVFCRLGIGLFGSRIADVNVSEEDLDSAKKYLDYIEKTEIWNGMEARRQMLFHLAMAEFFKFKKQPDKALFYAREAHRLGTEKNWKSELPSIKLLLGELEATVELQESHESDVESIELHLEQLES